MAMDASAMAASIVTGIKTINTGITAPQEADLITYWTPICQGIIDEIIAGTETSTEVTAGSSAGTYTGTVTG